MRVPPFSHHIGFIPRRTVQGFWSTCQPMETPARRRQFLWASPGHGACRSSAPRRWPLGRLGWHEAGHVVGYTEVILLKRRSQEGGGLREGRRPRNGGGGERGQAERHRD